MRTFSLSLFFVFLLFVVSCTPAEKPQETVKIGFSSALTGPFAATSQWALNGIDLALERLPTEERARIQLIIENDESKPATGMTIAQKFAEIENIKYIVGPLNGQVIVPTAAYYDEHKMLRMHPGLGLESTITTGTYKFFLLGELKPLMQALATYGSTHSISTVSILYLNNEYGLDNLNWFEKYYTQAGGKILAKEAFELGENDVRTQLTKIKATKPDAVFLITAGPALVSALKQMDELGITTKKLSLINTEDTEVVKSAGRLIEGVLYPTIIDTTQSDIKTWFGQRYQEKFSVPHEAVAASAFDSFNILWAAIKKCGDDTDCAKAEIGKTRNYVGASGAFSVDERGVGIRTPAIKTVKDGKFVYIE